MIGIKVEPEIKKELQKLAQEESCNLSNFCYHAIKVYVKEHFKVALRLLCEIYSKVLSAILSKILRMLTILKKKFF